jgi:hypothetical protein
VRERLRAEEKRLQAEIRTRIEEEQSGTLRSLQEELNQKSAQVVKELNRTKAENERLKREKDEMKEGIEAE